MTDNIAEIYREGDENCPTCDYIVTADGEVVRVIHGLPPIDGIVQVMKEGASATLTRWQKARVLQEYYLKRQCTLMHFYEE